MSRLKVRRTSRCNFLSLFSTFLPILNLECKLQHISELIILISHIWFGTFLGFRTFWWAKTNVEKGCWTWEITMNCLNYTFSNLSNFFFRATFLMCVLKVEPLPSTIIAVFEHSGTFERHCQTKLRHYYLVKLSYNFLWNVMTWVSSGKSSRALSTSGIEVVEVGVAALQFAWHKV